MPGVDGVDRLVDGSAGIVRAPNMQDHFPETHSCDWEIVAGVEDPRDAFAEDLGIIFVGKVAKAFYFGFFVAAVGRIVDHDRKLIRHRFIVRGERSEEHTSELQSLMRISYAVFCLKKNNTKHYMS